MVRNLFLFFSFIVVINYAVAWLFFPLIGLVDGNSSIYQNDFILWAHPYFENVTRILFFVGMGFMGWLWFRTSNWKKRLLRSSLTFIIIFPLVAYFNPSVLLRSLFIPGWFIISSVMGHMAPTKYAKDFSMSLFSKIKAGHHNRDIIRRLGTPLSEVENKNGATTLYYSLRQEDADYWRVGIQKKSNGIVANRIFHYYID